MNFFKDYPAFSASIIILIIVFLGGVFFDYKVAIGAKKAETQMLQAKRELETLLSSSPAPIKENLEISEKNIEALEAELKNRTTATRGRVPNLIEKVPPRTGTQLLFKLQAYRDQFKAEAAEEVVDEIDGKSVARPKIALPKDFAFGFSRYIGTGDKEPPSNEYVAQIFQQKEILTYILSRLYDTDVRSIISVQRQAVIKPKTSGNNNPRKRATPQYEDEFVIDESISSAVEGAVIAHAFLIEFAGYTSALQKFLTQLEAFELPLVVRSVEVKPAAVVKDTASSAVNKNPFSLFESFVEEDPQESYEKSKVPVVENNESHFAVTIEYIDVQSADFNSSQHAAVDFDGSDDN